MRPFMQKRIDSLHDEIARLIEVEKKWERKHNPQSNDLWRHVQDTRNEWFAHSPKWRDTLGG